MMVLSQKMGEAEIKIRLCLSVLWFHAGQKDGGRRFLELLLQ